MAILSSGGTQIFTLDGSQRGGNAIIDVCEGNVGPPGQKWNPLTRTRCPPVGERGRYNGIRRYRRYDKQRMRNNPLYYS